MPFARIAVVLHGVGTPEKARSTAAQLVSAIESRLTGFDQGNPRLLQLPKAADVPEAP
jgi:hypothetical protein